MQDTPNSYETSLEGLSWYEWLDALEEMTDADGYVEPLGSRHAAVFIEEKPTLLVTFETHRGIAGQSAHAHPLGWEMHKTLGWSHLCVVSDGPTWFRDADVYTFFDRLIDDGFFEEFDQVVFYGAGACGYAAAAFSVAAPGAQVVLLEPQATLDPRVTEWDARFLRKRRVCFNDRFGFAPDMIDAAEQVFVLYDPTITEDAMHAALFTRPNVSKFRMRHLGGTIEESLMRMEILTRIFTLASAGDLDDTNLARLFRARRADPGYQFGLLQHLRDVDRPNLTLSLCRIVLKQRETPPFRKALMAAEARLGMDTKAYCAS